MGHEASETYATCAASGIYSETRPAMLLYIAIYCQWKAFALREKDAAMCERNTPLDAR